MNTERTNVGWASESRCWHGRIFCGMRAGKDADVKEGDARNVQV